MKRSLTAVVVAMALLIPASASAASKKYVGEFEKGGKVSFKVYRGGAFGHNLTPGPGNIQRLVGKIHRRTAEGYVFARGRVFTDDGIRNGCQTPGRRGRVEWHAKRV